MEILNIVFSFLYLVIFLIFVERFQTKRDKEEQKKFREFVIAIKSKDLKEYVEVIPEEKEEVKEIQQDEYVDVDEVSPETLLKALKNENK